MTRILIVEDSAFQARVLSDILEGAGFQVGITATAEDSLCRIAEETWDLVISDFLLPDLGGYELCRRIREVQGDRHIPVILLTPRSDPADLFRGLAAGADAFLPKDRDPRDMLARVRRVLAYPVEKDPVERTPIEINFGGQHHLLVLRKEQLVEVLLSTFEDMTAIQQQSSRQQAARSHQLQLNAQIQNLNARIEKLASRDPLTELLNLRGLEQKLVQARGLRGRMPTDYTFFLVRCTNYQSINARLGYAVGDILLRDFARRILDAVYPDDLVARVGGEEFLVVIPDILDEHVPLYGKRIWLALTQQAVALSMEVLRPTAVIGYRRYLAIPNDLTETAARLHMLMLPHEENDFQHIFDLDEPRSRRVTESQDFLREMAHDLKDGRGLRTLIHPIYHLGERRIAGYELLSRGPAGIFELPQDFFRFCFDSNILTQVDLHCVRRSVRTALRMDEPLRFHVNMYPSTLLATPVDHILAIFSERRERFVIELSEEQILGDPMTLLGPVAALKAAGLSIAIDDVGFGKSWLESLLILEPDLVKIDKRTVAGISGNPGLLRMFKRLLRVIQSLDAEIVAEGIESHEDLHTLIDLGVTYGQGFLWGGPESADQNVPSGT